jgi:hypothetical protein
MTDRDPLEELRRILAASPVLLGITLRALEALRPPPAEPPRTLH